MRIDVQYNQVPQRALSFWEKYQIAELLCQYPALTLKVLLHRQVGLRRAEPSHVFLMAAILFAIGYAGYDSGQPHPSRPSGYGRQSIYSGQAIPDEPPEHRSSPSHGGLMLFAVAVAVAGYWQHFNRWKELRAGALPPWHTYSDGISPLEELILMRLEAVQRKSPPPAPSLAAGLTATASLPAALPPAQLAASTAAAPDLSKAKIPEGLRNLLQWGKTIPVFRLEWWVQESRVYRRLDPLVMYAIGLLVLFWVDRPLGLWITFAAACLAADENLKWRHQVKAYLDWHDSQIDGAVMRGWSGKKGGSRVQPRRSRRQTYGLPTGIGEDIRARVEEQAAIMQQQRRADQREEQAAQPGPPVLSAPDNRAK